MTHEKRGKRFVERYERRAAERRANKRPIVSPLTRIGRLLVGVVIVLLGILMLVFPGPGIVAMLAGLLILAGEFRILAVVLDRGEEFTAPVATSVWRVFRSHARECFSSRMMGFAVTMLIGAFGSGILYGAAYISTRVMPDLFRSFDVAEIIQLLLVIHLVLLSLSTILAFVALFVGGTKERTRAAKVNFTLAVFVLVASATGVAAIELSQRV